MLIKTVAAALFGACMHAALAQPASAPSAGPHRALYMYQGADRDAKVIAGAKKEKQVVVYTSLNTKDSVPITQAFEKKYGVKVELWRSSSEKVLQRAVIEARAGRFVVDAFELNGPELEAIYREGLLEEFYSPHFKSLPPAAFPKHRHYAADRFNFFTIAYNTNLVKPSEVPNSYEDLAHPRWTGRIGIEAREAGPVARRSRWWLRPQYLILELGVIVYALSIALRLVYQDALIANPGS